MRTKTITPGARLKAAFCGSVTKTDAEWDELAAKCGIQPVEVAPKTDGELWNTAWASCDDDDGMAVEFLRLVRERDGEPLPVTVDQVCDWWHKRCVNADNGWEELSRIINAHRGVLPATELPKVTVEMLEEAMGLIGPWQRSADYLNAELAKLAGKAVE